MSYDLAKERKDTVKFNIIWSNSEDIDEQDFDCIAYVVAFNSIKKNDNLIGTLSSPLNVNETLMNHKCLYDKCIILKKKKKKKLVL